MNKKDELFLRKKIIQAFTETDIIFTQDLIEKVAQLTGREYDWFFQEELVSFYDKPDDNMLFLIHSVRTLDKELAIARAQLDYCRGQRDCYVDYAMILSAKDMAFRDNLIKELNKSLNTIAQLRMKDFDNEKT